MEKLKLKAVIGSMRTLEVWVRAVMIRACLAISVRFFNSKKESSVNGFGKAGGDASLLIIKFVVYGEFGGSGDGCRMCDTAVDTAR